jgi:hypothetical protein
LPSRIHISRGNIYIKNIKDCENISYLSIFSICLFAAIQVKAKREEENKTRKKQQKTFNREKAVIWSESAK